MLCRVFAFLCRLISACCTKVRALADELAHRPGVYLDMCRDLEVQQRILESIPQVKVMFRDCDRSRRTVEIKGLNFDMRENQFMGHNAIVGIRFIYQPRSTMYSTRDDAELCF